jgi:hypothetical protein
LVHTVAKRSNIKHFCNQTDEPQGLIAQCLALDWASNGTTARAGRTTPAREQKKPASSRLKLGNATMGVQIYRKPIRWCFIASTPPVRLQQSAVPASVAVATNH